MSNITYEEYPENREENLIPKMKILQIKKHDVWKGLKKGKWTEIDILDRIIWEIN